MGRGEVMACGAWDSLGCTVCCGELAESGECSKLGDPSISDVARIHCTAKPCSVGKEVLGSGVMLLGPYGAVA